VSGGHTNLFWVESATGGFQSLSYRLIGRTRDDAAGEGYDKGGRLLGLPYPGGPLIDPPAKLGNRKAPTFSLSKFSDGGIDFSFSGVKTAVLQMFRRENLQPKNEAESREDPQRLDIIASFQESVIQMLWATTYKAVAQLRPKSLMLSGGVAANSRLK